MGRRNNRRNRRQQRSGGYEPVGKFEYPGVMGWMQRNGRVLLIFGIVLMVASIGAGAFALNAPTPPVEPATPTPAATEAPTPAEATPTAEPRRTYSAPPEVVIDPAKAYTAVLYVADLGTVTIELLPQEAPGYVNNFVFLAREGFYDGLTFHRVVPGFVAQAGDPTGTSTGGAGYTLPEEDNAEPFTEGVLSMAKSALGVSGSQFFITLAATPHLEAQGFTVFGRVVEGMDVLQQLTPRDPAQGGQPRGSVIERIEIRED